MHEATLEAIALAKEIGLASEPAGEEKSSRAAEPSGAQVASSPKRSVEGGSRTTGKKKRSKHNK